MRDTGLTSESCEIKPRREIATEVFLTGASAYANDAMWRWARRLWIPLSIPVIGLMVFGAVADWRFMLVAAFIVFLLYPLCALLGWFGSMTDHNAVKAAYPRKVCLQPDRSLTVTYLPIPEQDPTPPTSEHIASESILSCEIWRKNFIIIYRNKPSNQPQRLQKLFIPLSAFQSEQDAHEFFSFLPNGSNEP